jgi:hypothetical protein
MLRTLPSPPRDTTAELESAASTPELTSQHNCLEKLHQVAGPRRPLIPHWPRPSYQPWTFNYHSAGSQFQTFLSGRGRVR